MFCIYRNDYMPEMKLYKEGRNFFVPTIALNNKKFNHYDQFSVKELKKTILNSIRLNCSLIN